MDVLIRAGLVLALAVLCYRIFSPFIGLMAWALILAVTLYPAHQKLARKMGGKTGARGHPAGAGRRRADRALPTAVLMGSMGDSVHDLVGKRARQHAGGSRHRPRAWPSGRSSARRSIGAWSQAHTDLPAVVKSLQPQARRPGRRRRWRWWPASPARCCCSWPRSSSPASSWPSAESGAAATRHIFGRIVGTRRGDEFATLSTRDDSRGGAGCARRGLHPGHRRRPGHDDRRHSVRRRARHDRAGAGHRAGARRCWSPCRSSPTSG